VRVGLLTISQSPRADVVPELGEATGPNLIFVERGALDGMDAATLADWSPQPGDRTLVSRMRDGREVTLARRCIADRMQQCISELEREDSRIIILLCTGEFDELESSKPLLHPDRVLRNVVRSVAGELLGT